MTFTTMCAPITRGELARRLGCHLETIRYYETIGLLPPPDRSDGGHRLYRDDDLKRLRFILRGRELGFSIREIRSLFSLAGSGIKECGEIHDLTIRHLESVRSKIEDLQRLQRTLTRISGACAGGRAPACPVIDALWADEEVVKRPG